MLVAASLACSQSGLVFWEGGALWVLYAGLGVCCERPGYQDLCVTVHTDEEEGLAAEWLNTAVCCRRSTPAVAHTYTPHTPERHDLSPTVV